jgi:multidrug resistance efflux pump
MQGPVGATLDKRVQRNGTDPDAAAPPSGGYPSTAPGDAHPVAAPAPDKTTARRSTRRALAALTVLVVLAVLGAGGAYWLYSRGYVSTDNAQVDGDKVEVTAPTTGTLVNWRGEQGAQVRTNQVIGRIKQGTSGAQPQMVIKSPGDGTIAVKNAVEGQWVTAGTQLATAYDFNKIYVTARVDETDIAGVRPGAPVDIAVDAYPGAAITGVVTDIQAGAAGQFSLFPQSNSTGNFQKVTQVVGVRIAFTNTAGQYLVPGMNVTVHIHKQTQP